jgi:hypothetical protein
VFARESEKMLAVPPADEPPTKPGLESPDSAGDSPRIDPQVSEVRLAKAPPPAPWSIPTVAIALEDLEWFDLDDEVRALVESLDGTTTLEALLARQPDRGRAMKALLGLAAQGVVEFRAR